MNRFKRLLRQNPDSVPGSSLLPGFDALDHGVKTTNTVISLGCAACPRRETVTTQSGSHLELSMPYLLPFEVATTSRLESSETAVVTRGSFALNMQAAAEGPCSDVEYTGCPFETEVSEVATRMRASDAVLESAIEPYVERF